MPTCSPRCVEPLCFLIRRNPKVRLPRILERRYSLSKRKFTKWLLHLHSSFHVFFSFFISLPLSYEFFSFVFYSFLLLFSLFLFSSHFPIISSSHFFLFLFFLFTFSLLLFGSLTVWVKWRKFPLPFLKPNVWLSIFLLFLFMTSYPTWLNMSHGIMPPMWLNVSHSFLCQVSHS